MVQQRVRQWCQQLRGTHRAADGFLLPVVIALGLGIGTISIYSLQSVAQNSSQLNEQYYNTLAREAAQAGIAAVKACVTSNPATWIDDNSFPSETNPLTPQKNCDGTAATNRSATISNDSVFSSTYQVTSVDRYPGSATGVVVTSIGEVGVKGPLGTKVSTVRESVRALATSITPASGPVSRPLAEISAGPTTTCAVTLDGEAFCWGSDVNKQLGSERNMRDDKQNLPTAVYNDASFAGAPGVAVSCFPFLGCSYNPGASPALGQSPLYQKKVTKISVGETHTCAVATDSDGSNGKAYCWGKNDDGQLGTRNTTDSKTPQKVDDAAYVPPEPDTNICGGFLQRACYPARPASALYDKVVTDITAGNGFTCVIFKDNNTATNRDVACWGINGNGQLGTGNRTDYNYPVAASKSGTQTIHHDQVCSGFWPFISCTPAYDEVIPASALAGKQVKTLAKLKGGATMCIITTEDKSVCWGQNFAGQVGNGGQVAPQDSGSGYDQQGSGNACDRAVANAVAEAKRNAPMYTAYDALQATEVQTTLVFDSLTVVSNLDESTSESGTYHSYVTGKTSSASANPNRLYYWGGTMTLSISTRCHRNSDTQGSDNTRGYADITRTYSGQTTPGGPLYNTSAAGNLNGQQLALVSGNARTGLFCAKPIADPNLYCDGHGSVGREGQLGNGQFYPGSCNWLGCNYPPLPTVPQTVYTAQGSYGTAHLQGKVINAMDSGKNGHTCVVTDDRYAYCWGLNTSGQLGDMTFDNKAVPTPVNYTDSGSGLYGGGSGSSTTPPTFDIQTIF